MIDDRDFGRRHRADIEPDRRMDAARCSLSPKPRGLQAVRPGGRGFFREPSAPM